MEKSRGYPVAMVASALKIIAIMIFVQQLRLLLRTMLKVRTLLLIKMMIIMTQKMVSARLLTVRSVSSPSNTMGRSITSASP
jgi:hypothetical protein